MRKQRTADLGDDELFAVVSYAYDARTKYTIKANAGMNFAALLSSFVLRDKEDGHMDVCILHFK